MIVNSVKESGLLIKWVSEGKETKSRFLIMLLGPLDASLLGNLSTGKRSRISAGESAITASHNL